MLYVDDILIISKSKLTYFKNSRLSKKISEWLIKADDKNIFNASGVH